MKKLLFCALIISLAACAPSPAPLQLSSSAFANEGTIPAKFTCDGSNISPALSWTEPPAGTKSFAIIIEDKYAPPASFIHWVIYNIPASTRALQEAVPTEAQLSDGSLQGKNSAGTPGYQGPCPPSGTHRYVFTLYALDSMLSLSGSANKLGLTLAMDGHILSTAELIGTFR
jgi:Raf kinase inhibitor-like YbhB/YbcL family protein